MTQKSPAWVSFVLYQLAAPADTKGPFDWLLGLKTLCVPERMSTGESVVISETVSCHIYDFVSTFKFKLLLEIINKINYSRWQKILSKNKIVSIVDIFLYMVSGHWPSTCSFWVTQYHHTSTYAAINCNLGSPTTRGQRGLARGFNFLLCDVQCPHPITKGTFCQRPSICGCPRVDDFQPLWPKYLPA